MGIVEDFNSYRSRMNEKILASDSLVLKRIFKRAFEFWEELHHV